MDIRNFITFNTIVETGGFTKAADKLNYAQSTVTLHIKELEKHYKVQIFDRISKKVFLTAFGSELYDKSIRLVEDYENTLSLNSRDGGIEVIRIGVYESLLRYRLYDLIHEYKKSHPNVDMVIQHGTCKSLRKMIQSGELDLTFQIEPIREFSDLKVMTLCKEEFKLILPKNQTIDYIYEEHQTVYLTEKECSYRNMFEHYLDKKGVIRQHVMETGSVDMIKQYVGLELGYSMIPAVSLRNKGDRDNIEILDVKWEKDLYTQLVHHKDKHIFSAMKDFIELVEVYSKDWK